MAQEESRRIQSLWRSPANAWRCSRLENLERQHMGKKKVTHRAGSHSKALNRRRLTFNFSPGSLEKDSKSALSPSWCTLHQIELTNPDGEPHYLKVYSNFNQNFKLKSKFLQSLFKVYSGFSGNSKFMRSLFEVYYKFIPSLFWVYLKFILDLFSVYSWFILSLFLIYS